MRFSMVSAFRAAITVLVATFAFGQLPSSPSPSYRLLSGGAALNIPVELIANGLVFVHAKVNHQPGWFILDNAAQGFTVDRDYARQISLQSSGSATARADVADAIQVGIVKDVEVSLAGLDLTHRNLVVTNLKTLEPIVGHEVDGILGSRLFDDFVVVVDYERRQVSVYPPKEYKPSRTGTEFPVRIDEHGFQFIDATIALPGLDPITSSFLIDGGANTYADIYKPFSDAHGLPPRTMKLLDAPGTGTGGTTPSKDGRADQIGVGSYSIKNPPITFTQAAEGLMAAKDHAGLIGAEFLERFTVAFDNPGKRLWLTPNRNYGRPAAYDASGLRILAEGPGFHKFVVRRIVPESPAAEAGLQPGDIMESIDNSSTEGMTLTEIRSTLCESKATYSIGVVRGNRHLRVALRLHPLL